MKAATSEDRITAESAEFQSTPPVKAATAAGYAVTGFNRISIHAAREGGDLTGRDDVKAECISIHAAREGGDRKATRIKRNTSNFNPRRP